MYSFDPLDNDYIELVPSYWDTEMNLREDKPWLYWTKGPKLKPCGLEKEIEVYGADVAPTYPANVCLSDEEEVSSISNKASGDFRTLALNIIPCNSTRRPTCKSKEEIAAFLGRTIVKVVTLSNVVVEDQFSNDDPESISRFKGDLSNYFPI